MRIALLGGLGIIVFAILGSFRGIYRILAAFVSFLLAALLARTFSLLLLWPVDKIGIIPKSLVPLAGQIIAGIILFLLFYFVAGFILRMREEGRERVNQPRMETWERIGGALFGTAWGLFLVVFILTGIYLIGNVEEGLEKPPRSISEKEDHASAEAEEAPNGLTASESTFVKGKSQIEKSVFGPIVKKTDPVNEKIKEIFHNLRVVVSDPHLYEDFKSHPDIARFAQDPRILALSKDEVIQRQLLEKQYFKLLDNEKIASLAKDEDLISELKNVDLGEILREIIEK